MNAGRIVAVATSSRADYAHLYWPLCALRDEPEIDLRVIAFGAHLAPEFGATVEHIERDGFSLAARVPCLEMGDTDIAMARTIGRATLGLADVLSKMRPDLLLLIADRYEILAPATVALALRIPIAHIEGGEISEGAIDDAVRNALTKMSHVHFTPTARARERVLAMGEEPWRVHQSGAPSLDHLRHSALPQREALEKALQLSLSRPLTVASYHPVTLQRDTNEEADAFLAAMDRLDGQIVFCYPNSDAGGRELVRRIAGFCARRADARLFINLQAIDYLALLREADLFVGNSSSGIMETPSFALPCVNVGFRQQGRERAENIIDAPAQASAIVEAMAHARSPAFRAALKNMVNPYGDGHAGERICRVLRDLPLGDQLLVKHAVSRV